LECDDIVNAHVEIFSITDPFRERHPKHHNGWLDLCHVSFMCDGLFRRCPILKPLCSFDIVPLCTISAFECPASESTCCCPNGEVYCAPPGGCFVTNPDCLNC